MWKAEIALVAFLLLLGQVAAPRAGAPSLIEQAQAAAGRDDHASAIDAYLSAIAADSTLRPVVAVELGAQYTWAGRFDDAIRTLCEFLEKEPDHVEALMLLGLAQSWGDHTEDALRTYRHVLQIDPAHADALLGEARMLSWRGRLDAALAAYDELLLVHPDHTEALLGRAMVTNWRGDHRRAARLYEEVSRRRPEATAPLEGYAAAWNWGGRPDRALTALSRAIDLDGSATGAIDLDRAIRRAWRLAGTFTIDLSRDSDSFEAVTARMEGDIPVAYRARLRPVAQWLTFSRRGPQEASESWYGFTAEHRLADSWLAYGDLLVLAARPAGIGVEATGALHLAWLPGDRVRFDGGFARASLFRFASGTDGDASRLGFDIFDVGCSLRPFWRTSLHAAGDRGTYDDGNRRWSVRARLRQNLIDRPKVGVEVGGHLLDFLHPGSPGMWAPDDYRALLLAGDLDVGFRRGWGIFARCDTGWAKERGGAATPYATFSGGTTIEAGRLRLEIRASRSDSNLETGRGYRRSAGAAVVRVRL